MSTHVALEGSPVVAVVARSEAAARGAMQRGARTPDDIPTWRHVVPGEPLYGFMFSAVLVADDLEPEQGAAGLEPEQLRSWWSGSLVQRLTIDAPDPPACPW